MKPKTELTGMVIYRNDPEYNQARMNWNPFTNTFPIVFVFAQPDKDVANAVKWARENNVPIRMRSGRRLGKRFFSNKWWNRNRYP
jgi:FAD/FMN-containing dehydrogenase